MSQKKDGTFYILYVNNFELCSTKKLEFMDKHIIFKEVQKQNQKWIWFLLLILITTTVFGSVQQIIFNKPFGNNPIPNWGFVIIFGVLFFIFYILNKSNLYTEISNDYVLFHYKPFFRKPKIINCEQIDNIYVRIYSPIKEYGGWGIRTSFDGRNKAYNVSGKIGIQIELKNGKRILIGTQKMKEAEIAIKSMCKDK